VTGTGAGSVEEARRNLLGTGLFSDVRVSQRGSQVLVVVRENTANRVVNRVAFEGNKKIEKATLQNEVRIQARGPFSQAAVDADIARIQDAYRRVGRANAKVSARLVELPNGRTDVVFTIDEGDKTGIKEISFVGNRAYSASHLRELMSTSEMNFLSFFKTSDVYDPDRVAQDLEIVRRYYLKHGYADFQVVSSDAQFDPVRGGWVLNIVVNEGERYTVGNVTVDSRLAGVDPTVLRKNVATDVGDVYDAEAVERSLIRLTREAARAGNPFAQVRPVGRRDPATHMVEIGYVVEEGPHVYIERINIRGNTRTRDYVIRREFDLGEGDAYNKVLMDRAERRLNNLGYFKKVRISNEPGSGPDRVIVVVDVEDQPTGSFSVSGGYSTADGVISEVSVTESNFLGLGQYVRLAGQYGQRAKGVDFSFTEPYFMGYRMAAGFDLFAKFVDNTRYARYDSQTIGGQVRLGLPVTEEFGVTLRYSIYDTKLKIPNSLKQPFNDCSVPIPGYTALNPATVTDAAGNVIANPAAGAPFYPNCAYDGEASLAVKEARGSTLTSLGGLTLAYSTLDNVKNPHDGFYAEVKPEAAGLGGDSKFVRVTGDARYYKELWEDVVGIARLQGGTISPFGDKDLRITDHFNLGPSLVRGFAPSGIGPRDVSLLDSRSNALGGTTYWGASLEVQFPLWGLPRDLGLKGAVFADAGSLFGYKGKRTFDLNGNGSLEGAGCAGFGGLITSVQPECVSVRDNKMVRSSVGASILWNSPLGPLRFDYAWALSKDNGFLDPRTGIRLGQDQTQAFRFSGGSRF
jgi:outer membrane protein insertion porin family